jgi:hypothetical protein
MLKFFSFYTINQFAGKNGEMLRRNEFKLTGFKRAEISGHPLRAEAYAKLKAS